VGALKFQARKPPAPFILGDIMKKIILALLISLCLIIPSISHALKVVWEHPRVVEEQIDFFCIHEVKNGAPVKLGCVPSDQFFYDLGDLTPGVYVYYATAHNLWGDSLPSETYSTPLAPTSPINLEGQSVTVMNITADTVNITTDKVEQPKIVK
jgi:hypothetical protein